MMGGFQKTASVHPRGVNPNDKTVMIYPPPPGRTWRGVNENFSPDLITNINCELSNFAEYFTFSRTLQNIFKNSQRCPFSQNLVKPLQMSELSDVPAGC